MDKTSLTTKQLTTSNKIQKNVGLTTKTNTKEIITTTTTTRKPSTSLNINNQQQQILKPPKPPAPPLPARRKSLLNNNKLLNTTINTTTTLIREEQIPERATLSEIPNKGNSTSPRMRRFAERLAVIQISLDPPSPPEFSLQSPDENESNAPVPFWAQPGYENYFRPIEDSLLLQVPRVLDQDDSDPMRECSPPPRRCSYASTVSENSSISLNTSYQSLLFSPLICCPDQCVRSTRSGSTCCSECEADTPPTNESEFIFSSQQQQKEEAKHRSKRVSVCNCQQQLILLQQKRQQRQRRSHSAVSTPCEPISPSPTVLLSPVLLSRPIRSQSAHSPNFLRNFGTTGAAMIGGGQQQQHSDSDSESITTTTTCCSRGGGGSASILSRQSYSRLSNSRLSNCSSPLAGGRGTPPPLVCSPPIGLGIFGGGNGRNVTRSGSFSRYNQLQQQHSFSSVGSNSGNYNKIGGGGHHFINNTIGRCNSFTRTTNSNINKQPFLPHPLLQRTTLNNNNNNSFSQYDSFDSTTSAGEPYIPHSSNSFSSSYRRGGSSQIYRQQQHYNHHNYQQQQLNPLLAGRSPSAATQLQRSQSDALNPIPSRHSSAESGGFDREDFQSVTILGGGGDKLLLNNSGGGNNNLRIGTTNKRPSISLRDLKQQDFHSSLDSGSYREHHFHSIIGVLPPLNNNNQHYHHQTGTTTSQLHLLSNLRQFNNNNNNLLIMRYKHCPSLGHSDPQLYTHTQQPFFALYTSSNNAGGITNNNNSNSGMFGGLNNNFTTTNGSRRSFLSSSPQAFKLKRESFTGRLQHSNAACSNTSSFVDSTNNVKNPVKMRMHRTSFSSMSTHQQQHSSNIHHHNQHHRGSGTSASARPSISAGCSSGGIRQPVALRALPPGHHLENRRWSLASLPSSSGYGTPGTNSAYSSQYSSQENLANIISDIRIRDRFDSNESYACYLGDDFGGLMRPRSRSLTSPIPHLFERLGVDSPMMLASVYKERFPKAKHQMENRLMQFLQTNAQLSGFTSQMLQLNIVPPSPMPIRSSDQQNTQQQSFVSIPPSPRPSSPNPHRPLSPLVTESATAIGDSVIHHRSSNSNFLSAGNSAGFSPNNSFFGGGNSTTQLHQLNQGQDGGVINEQQLNNNSTTTIGISSPLFGCSTNNNNTSSTIDTNLLRLISDGATRFLHHQLCEIVSDCLQKSRDDLLNCVYFCSMSVRLDETLNEAEVKVGPDSYKYLFRLVKQILMIVSRTARLLECLEFNPDEFYQLLGDAEVAVREQLGSGSAKVPDLPQYILTKLGLNKNISSLEEEENVNIVNNIENDNDDEELNLKKEGEGHHHLITQDPTLNKQYQPSSITLQQQQSSQSIREAPKEEDFEHVRLISNGAYGAVYLVKHKKTRQRFALKKMKKHTLLLRNQIEQVYAERDILTFTDNPFVVCFYGSFETKQHLCMLMEYVEGGDCASLLKSAGTLPIELSRLYVAETVMAIEYLHSCGIVHRDLKPDNLLITSMGHIKLTDFGLSKIGLMNRTTLVSEGYLQDDTQQFKDNQLCGTPEYIAPEVILRQGYGKPVDWWALGVILYEFLVGIVPFLGDSPEALFANIINEEVEYPEGEEALNPDAESLIRMLLEKNPADRLGTMGGAVQVSSHPFFSPIDFGSILRQKAEFVPQLENDEDTSYFDSRTDRYNHDAESEVAEDDEQVPMFWSFSTASPRHSIVGGLELPIGGMAMLQAAHAAAIERSQLQQQQHLNHLQDLDNDDKASSGLGSAPGSTLGLPQQPSSRSASRNADLLHEPSSLLLSPSEQLQQQSSRRQNNNNINNKSQRLNEFSGSDVIPSAVILRRRFSSQRHSNTTTNMSTSSSGTGTGTGQTNNTCSSTDSSLDASQFQYDVSRKSHGQLPRLAISPCANNNNNNASSSSTHLPLQRGGGGGDQHHQRRPEDLLQTNNEHLQHLSPVQERWQENNNGGRQLQKKRPSTVVHELITDSQKQIDTRQQQQKPITTNNNNNNNLQLNRQLRSTSCRIPNSIKQPSETLRVQIPQQQQQQSSNSTQTTSTNTIYYHSYGLNAAQQQVHSSSSGQQSPSCASVSSVSSYDGQKQQQQNNIAAATEASTTSLDVQQSGHSTSTLPSPCSLLPPPTGGGGGGIGHPISHRTSISGGLSRPIVIRKGAQGFGFTIRSVRVYLSESSEYYSIEHIVSAVRENSPAMEAGLRINDLISHVHTQSVHNMTHPQLMHRLLSCGNELTLHVVPLNNTTIKEGEPRKNIGKPLRKKPLKQQQRLTTNLRNSKCNKIKNCGGNSTTNNSSASATASTSTTTNVSLLRRLSGKRGGAVDIVPGTSSQKQTFMPRSVSSQEGILASNNNNNNSSQQQQKHDQTKQQFLITPEQQQEKQQTSSSSSQQQNNQQQLQTTSTTTTTTKRKSIPSASLLLDSVRRKL